MITNDTSQKLVEAARKWGDWPLDPGKTYEKRYGPLMVQVRSVDDEIWILFQDLPGNPEDGEPTDNDLQWSRWVLKGHDNNVQIIPVFPDRPVVVRTEHPFRIVKGAKARIYIQVPVWLRVAQTGSNKDAITEIASVELSKTWFGTNISGEHCYWIPTTANRQIDSLNREPHLIICPVQIANNSEDDLNVEKLALQVQRLSIFEHNEQLWSDEVRVTYRGKGDVSKLDFLGKVPKETGAGKRLSTPRDDTGKGLAAKTFSGLKDFSDLIGL